MLKIDLVTESDRVDWETLSRGHHAHFDADHPDDSYDRAWRRVLDADPVRAVLARLDGKAVGVANYLFHASIWYVGKCYLADLFVLPELRRQGIATAVIEWIARDAKDHGFPGLYWNTLEDAPARALYDKVAVHREGLVTYGYRRSVR
ncbi:GNAT family N-acetyltransferase [Kutzneria kofuensis]|uniref:GNAT superfamily N-acetyltransferase n=1 Tax=Kutzneria kofuensis TaxID=103725 RepID=A0A7W9KB73_9PSEU|nr:GNAT family N-acetyltransferase [Kutzneria kofuensis]MBB5888948.1 GNAT superfamily N-acetyltransferase [Kutzneria kofuensis]